MCENPYEADGMRFFSILLPRWIKKNKNKNIERYENKTIAEFAFEVAKKNLTYFNI